MPKFSMPLGVAIPLILFWAVMSIVSFTQADTFSVWVQEDGWVENLTVVAIGIAFCVIAYRFYLYRKGKAWGWQAFMLFLLLALFFGIGEEISWGQRLFGFETNEFFWKNNTQSETNLHNLVFKGIKLNFVISQVFVWSLAIYLLVLPYFYTHKIKVQNTINHWGIPIPKNYQIILMLIPIVLMAIIQHDKKWEMLEASIAIVGCLILIFPRNKASIYGDKNLS